MKEEWDQSPSVERNVVVGKCLSDVWIRSVSSFSAASLLGGPPPNWPLPCEVSLIGSISQYFFVDEEQPPIIMCSAAIYALCRLHLFFSSSAKSIPICDRCMAQNFPSFFHQCFARPSFSRHCFYISRPW